MNDILKKIDEKVRSQNYKHLLGCNIFDNVWLSWQNKDAFFDAIYAKDGIEKIYSIDGVRIYQLSSTTKKHGKILTGYYATFKTDIYFITL